MKYLSFCYRERKKQVKCRGGGGGNESVRIFCNSESPYFSVIFLGVWTEGWSLSALGGVRNSEVFPGRESIVGQFTGTIFPIQLRYSSCSPFALILILLLQLPQSEPCMPMAFVV